MTNKKIKKVSNKIPKNKIETGNQVKNKKEVGNSSKQKLEIKKQNKAKVEEKNESQEILKNKKLNRVSKNRSLYLEEAENIKKTQSNLSPKEENKLDTNTIDKSTKEKKQQLAAQKIKRIIKKKNQYKLTTIILSILFLILLTFNIAHFIFFNHNKVKTLKEIQYETAKNYVFVGDSITDFWNIHEAFPNTEKYNIINSGIGGYMSKDILSRMNNLIYQFDPAKVFLLIGTNDIQHKQTDAQIIENIEEITSLIKEHNETTEIYIESVYPVNEVIKGDQVKDRTNKRIKQLNKKIEEVCKEKNYTYIDIYSELIDSTDNLDKNYTEEGLHINEEGYKVVKDTIKKYID